MAEPVRKVLNEALHLSVQWEATARQAFKDVPCVANAKKFSAARILKEVTATAVMTVPLTDVDAELTMRRAKAILHRVQQEICASQKNVPVQ